MTLALERKNYSLNKKNVLVGVVTDYNSCSRHSEHLSVLPISSSKENWMAKSGDQTRRSELEASVLEIRFI